MKDVFSRVNLKTCVKVFLFTFLLIVSNNVLKSQIINEGFEEPGWVTGIGAGPGGSTSGQITVTGTSANSIMTYYTASSSTTTALNTNHNSGVWWYSKVCTNTDNKLRNVHSASHAPKLGSSGYVITPVTSSAIVSVTFWALMGSPMTVGIATDPTIGQPSYSSANPIPGNFANFSTSFPINTVMTSYSINFTGVTGPVRIGFFNYGGNSSYIDDIIVMQPTGTPPTVTTNGATPGITNAIANGTVTPGTLPLLANGIIWSKTPLTNTKADTALTTKTWNRPADNGPFGDTLSPLTPNTTYYYQAYVIGLDNNVFLGAVKTFTTKAINVPTVTIKVNTVSSNKADVTGNAIDSGGAYISEKGFSWNISGSATINTRPIGSGIGSFNDLIKSLNPSTKYCVRAYAKNSVGIGYSPDSCFTTGAPVPALTAIPGVLDFGEIFLGSNAIVTSYYLTGTNLSPSSGSITITIPAGGFKISLTGNLGDFKNTATINYTGGKIPKTPIFVQMSAATFGSFSSTITHSGGGVSPADADVVKVTGSVIQSPDDISNSGTDFYLGFGYQEKMSRQAGDADECRLSVYVTNPNPTQSVKVHCDLTSGGYSQVTTIPAGGSFTFSGFPMGDATDETNPGNLPDARLFSTGISSKSIHVYSEGNTPVAVHMHSYTHGNSAAGAMVFPTNTWNSSYTVQAFGGESNNSNPNSFFFVIANEDNTVVTFKPTQPILDASAASLFNENQTTAGNTQYAANGTYTVTLNKGQVFNALGGFSPSGNGLDLSGTKVSTTCDKKITVFGGNGRCLVGGLSCTNASGSDHMIQQMFPSVAWGTKYLTAPTTGSALNYFRIYFQDATTVVKVNGTTLTAANLVSVSGTPIYYQYQSATPLSITSDKPINVSQFQLTPGCTSEGFDGGPEMIILSPVEQAISNVVFYSPTSGKNIIDGSGSYTSYMNVIIPASKASTFKLDGVAPSAASFKVHPQNAAYSYASLLVTSKMKHSLTADTGFIAIAYGYGDGESYGFNAGTAVKNLSSYKFSVNPQGGDSSSTIVRTCVRTPITLKIGFPHNPTLVDKIVWEPNDARIKPNVTQDGAIVGGKAVYEGIKIVDGRTFYIYSSPTQYTFSENALYHFNVTAYGNFLSDCPGQDRQTILVNVGQDNLNLQADPKCNDPKVLFSADTIPMIGTHILSWDWAFGDSTHSTTSPLTPQLHDYGTTTKTAYKVKLTTLNSVGCYSSDSVDIDFGGGLKADFTISDDAICAGDNVSFVDASFGSGTSGSPNDWKWNFDSLDLSTTKKHDGQTPAAQSYATPGIKVISLTVTTPIGCVNTKTDTVTVEATPVAKFTAAPACLGSNMTFTDASTIAIGTIDARTWTFGEGPNVPVTSTNPTITHKYLTPGRYEVTLSVKSAGGCPSTVLFKDSVTVLPLPRDSFDIDVNCTTKEVAFTDRSVTNGGTVTAYNWVIDGVPASKGATFKQTFNDALSHTVSLTVTTSNGCTNTVGFSRSFTISASPLADFDLPAKVCLPNDAAIFTNKTTISDGTGAQISYVWDFGETPTQTQAQAAPAAMTISHPYATAKSYIVKLTATSGAGCTSTATKTLSTVYAQPKASFTAPAEVCVNAKAALSGTGAAGADWYWNFGTGFGTLSKKDTVGTWNVSGDTAIKHYYITALGCISDTVSKTITVNPLPVNLFDKDIDCSIKKVTFTDKSTTAPVGTTTTKRHWEFGDGFRDDGNNATVTHTYTGNGPYTATLWIESSKGCQDSSNRATTTFTISATPASSFTLPTGNICLPAGIATFINTSTISDGTQAGFINSWDFGDNTKKDTTLGLASVSHVFSGVGPYTIKLTTTSAMGCNNSAAPQVINTIFARPLATFTAPAEVCLNSNASFSGTGSTPGSTAAQWYWDLGNGSFGTASKKDTVAAWAVSGPQTIRHYLVSAAGCISDTATKTVTVNALPVASFSQVAVSCAGKTVNFADASTATAPATVVEWKWYFGDGQTSTLTTAGASHSYAVGGSYNAKLVVKDSKGCYSDTFRLTVNVYPNPVPGFTVSAVCIPSTNPVFTDTTKISSGSITDWQWSLGDNTDTLHVSTFEHIYTTGGIYKVTLTATSDQGCVTTGSAVDVTVTSAPIAKDSIVNAGKLCSSSDVTLINESVPNGFGTVSKVEIFWDNAGDLSQKTVDNAPAASGIYTHKYPDLSADKDYDVLIRAYSNSGCFKDSVRTIKLLASPKLDFLPLAGICEEKDTIQLAIPADANGLSIDSAYFIGNGIIGRSNQFYPLLAGPGNHIITYVDTATNGCVSKDTSAIFVYATPTIRMDAQRTVLLGDNITLNPAVTGNIQAYTWTPGTYLDNPAIIKPVTTPAEDITYNLNVVTKDGCEADSAVKVLVLIDFKVPNTFTPNNDSRNDFWIIEQLPRYPIQKVQVFNRYGQVVYETKKYDPRGWDGNYKGKPLPIGTYYYIIELDGMVEPKVGYVTILK